MKDMNLQFKYAQLGGRTLELIVALSGESRKVFRTNEENLPRLESEINNRIFVNLVQID